MLHILFGTESDPGRCLILCSRHIICFSYSTAGKLSVWYNRGYFSHILSGKDNPFIKHIKYKELNHGTFRITINNEALFGFETVQEGASCSLSKCVFVMSDIGTSHRNLTSK